MAEAAAATQRTGAAQSESGSGNGGGSAGGRATGDVESEACHGSAGPPPPPRASGSAEHPAHRKGAKVEEGVGEVPRPEEGEGEVAPQRGRSQHGECEGSRVLPLASGYNRRRHGFHLRPLRDPHE